MARSILVFLVLNFFGRLCPAAESVGPMQVGEFVPSATVQLENGQEVSLSSLITKPTVLIFYRGGWCPFCNRHLAALGEIQSELVATGAQLIALSPDSPSQLRAKPTQRDLPYQLVSDRLMLASQAMGIAYRLDDASVEKYKNTYKIDLEASSGATHHLLPHPAVFIVDGKGVIRFVHVNTNYKVRLDPREILAALRSVTTKAAESPH